MTNQPVPITHYIVSTKVEKLERKRKALRSVKTGEINEQGKPIYEVEWEDTGWFVLFEGSHEYIHLGFDEPIWKVGQEIEITMRAKSHGN